MASYETRFSAMNIGQLVSVLAIFDPSYKMRPLRFRWSGRLVKVEEITYMWKSKEGKNDIYHFSITDGNVLYELSYNTGSLLWRIEHLEA